MRVVFCSVCNVCYFVQCSLEVNTSDDTFYDGMEKSAYLNCE